jgi:hypothetical protein
VTHFRWRYRVQGIHVRVLVYVASAAAETHAFCGELVMSTTEWDAMRSDFEVGVIETAHDLVDLDAPTAPECCCSCNEDDPPCPVHE